MRPDQDAIGTVFGQGFPRSRRLLKHAQFESVYAGGKRHFSPLFTVFYLFGPAPDPAGSDGFAQVGFTVGRALGGAVTRNRIKRRLRDAARRELPKLEAVFRERGSAVQIVINPKHSLAKATPDGLRAELSRAFTTIANAAPRSVAATERR